MQCRRRGCCTRAAGLSFVFAAAVLLIFAQQARKTQSAAREKKIEEARPSSTRSVLNLTLGAVSGARIQQDVKHPLGSNGSLSEEIDSEQILKTEPYKYIHNEPEKCRRGSPFLVLMITVNPDDYAARAAIRQTWGNESAVKGSGLVRIFLLGVKNVAYGPHVQLQNSIKEESQKFQDIVQQEYVDSYYNLTIKTLMGMHWVATYCPNASYVMKTDSDMFVNTEYLIQKLLEPKKPPRRLYFTGYLMRGFKPNRDKNSKWYMSPELYASETYPNFCSGTGYVFSADVAGRIYQASLSIRRLHLEDVYVGICLAKLHIDPVPPPNDFLFNHWKVSYSSCKYSQLITSHHFRPAELINQWRHLQKTKHAACGRRTT
ncbi:beta-1,3-galactosyltransferase 2 [Trichomycterus rosablanca]|uniref:beta-1,3-galactosyltransferase 2 n=1 Tax=Trichomycterus rosablanca TaxID=2290929 RepID=UPI002F356D4D